MSQLKATPGPWEVYHDGFSIAAKDGHILSTFAEGATTEEALANANLIAAAPDLYEALVLATAYLSDLPHESAHKIASAIAKARGEASA